ncbi:MAG TPA: ATP-binding protein [Planctomycetia bacterium]|nr:ATP-binding protein [Planctomycetia bacterium]
MLFLFLSPAAVPDPPKRERTRINVSWLIKLRWAAFGGQLLTVLVVAGILRVPLPLLPLMIVLALEGLSNVALALWFEKVSVGEGWGEHVRSADRLLGAAIAADLFFLTLLLHLSGGAANPFCLFYLANLTLAAVVLRGRRVWVITAIAVAFYGSLYLWHRPLPELSDPVGPAIAEGVRDLRAAGAFTAFATAAFTIVYFTARVTNALIQRETELHEAQQRRLRDDKLQALGTLAAGAAHELASPLSTIAVVAKELALSLKNAGASADSQEDVQLVREEVDRCRTILRHMAADGGQVIGEIVETAFGKELVAAILQGVREPERLRVTVGPGVEETPILAPKHGLAQAVRGLIHNALDATAASGVEVELSVEIVRDWMAIEIRDRGPGLPGEILERAGEPFFTTKAPGKGMGLGIFLARSLVERLGGSTALENRLGGGAVARVRLPIAGSRL